VFHGVVRDQLLLSLTPIHSLCHRSDTQSG